MLGKRWLIVGCATLVACTGEPDREADRVPAGDGEREAELRSQGVFSPSDRPWSVVSSGGSRVTLLVPEGRLHPGPLRIGIEIDAAAVRPHSLDVVSPTMPMHGVVRVPVREGPDERFEARAEIPMEGRWAVYVNLDPDGGDTAEFLFDVEPEAGAESDTEDHTRGHLSAADARWESPAALIHQGGVS